eukprot:Hpha_TRINITY_DN35613_c0_g1::TRINITY_DN35613_c0_g1_i1::g.68565::m.68565
MLRSSLRMLRPGEELVARGLEALRGLQEMVTMSNVSGVVREVKREGPFGHGKQYWIERYTLELRNQTKQECSRLLVSPKFPGLAAEGDSVTFSLRRKGRYADVIKSVVPRAQMGYVMEITCTVREVERVGPMSKGKTISWTDIYTVRTEAGNIRRFQFTVYDVRSLHLGRTNDDIHLKVEHNYTGPPQIVGLAGGAALRKVRGAVIYTRRVDQIPPVVFFGIETRPGVSEEVYTQLNDGEPPRPLMQDGDHVEVLVQATDGGGIADKILEVSQLSEPLHTPEEDDGEAVE